MIIYTILKNGYFGGTQELPDGTAGIPLWTTRTAVPEIPEGMYARWMGTYWAITQDPPPPEPVPEPELMPEPDESVSNGFSDLDFPDDNYII